MAADDLTVSPFDDSASAWDRALEECEGSSFCHRYGWRAVMEEALGHSTFWLQARDGSGVTRGLLPLVRVRSSLFGDYLVSMPFLSYGGPIGSIDARRRLSEAAIARAGELGVDLLELRTRSELPGTRLTTNARKLTVVKDLDSTPEAVWEKGIKAKVRSQIRRPMKEGMTIRFGNHVLDPFYAVFSRSMRDLGTPVLPRAFFEAIRTHLADSVLFAVVELDGLPVASGCGFFWQGEFEITWAGSSRDHSTMAPNMLLYWGCMEECVRRGAHTFNFGRCSPDSGTHRFKRQWGSVDEPLPWLQWSPSGIVSTPSPDSPKFRAATNVWRRLPLGLTNFLGPQVSRFLP